MSYRSAGRRQRASTGRGDQGQAAVEVALALPLLCMLLLAVLQVGVVVRDGLAVQLAAREAARAAAVAADARAAAAATALATVSLRPLDVRVTSGGATVTVTVTYVDPTDVPMIGAVLPDVTVSASVTMAIEPPGAGR